MRLSCLPVSFFADIIAGRMSVVEWAHMAAAIGLDAIDLSILFVPDAQSPEGASWQLALHQPGVAPCVAAAAALRRDIEAAGMRVAMLTTYPDFTHPDPLQRARELSLEQDAVAVAAALGAELVRVTAGQAHPQTGREAGLAWATEGLTRLVEATRGSGVTLVYENHAKPGAWEHTDFSQPPDIFLEIVRRTANVGLGINFDTGNATAFADDPLALLDQVLQRVVSVHAADTAVRGTLQHVLLGTGLTPFAALFGRLKRAGWDGWICMEEASFQGQTGVEAAAHFIRRAWSESEEGREGREGRERMEGMETPT